jgi:hypothetical protein
MHAIVEWIEYPRIMMLGQPIFGRVLKGSHRLVNPNIMVSISPDSSHFNYYSSSFILVIIQGTRCNDAVFIPTTTSLKKNGQR